MSLSRGACRLLSELQSYARRSGWAAPFQSTLAAKLGVTERTIRRWLLKLRRAGALLTKKRQRTSAEYVIQCWENVRSNVRSKLENVRSKLTHPYMSAKDLVKRSGLAGRKPPQRTEEYAPSVNWYEAVRLARAGMPFDEACLRATA
jgi:hypothetical protein